MAHITDTQSRRNRTQRIQIALMGLLFVGLAVFITGSLMNRSGTNSAGGNDQASNDVVTNSSKTGKDDPLAEIGAAPVAEPEKDEDIPGTGATVNRVTGNVSDIPPQQKN